MSSTYVRNETNSTEFEPGTPYTITIEEVDVSTLRPHPENSYEMDKESIKNLAETIKEVGLIELPYTREVSDGGLQILSGHRRVSALKLLGKEDPSFLMQNVRVAHGLSDADALLILHTANIFRQLPQKERQRQVELLEEQIKELRPMHPEWAGLRTNVILAGMLDMSKATFVRQKKIARELIPELYDYYERGWITRDLAYKLTQRGEDYQKDMAKQLKKRGPRSKSQLQLVVSDYETTIPELLKVLDKQIVDLDGTLFQLIELMNRKDQLTMIDLDRLESIQAKLGNAVEKARGAY